MENASKALIIAGTVLLSMLVLSVLVYVFLTYSQYSYEYEQKRATEALVQSNTKFTKYIGQTLTAQDVITIYNLTEEYNNKNPQNTIELLLNNSRISNFINNNNESTNWKSFIEANRSPNGEDNKFTINGDGIVTRQDGTIQSINIVRN